MKELSDEAFGKVIDVSFPVDRIIDCLRFVVTIAKGVYYITDFVGSIRTYNS